MPSASRLVFERVLFSVRRMVVKLGADAIMAFASVWVAVLLQFQFTLPSPKLIAEHAFTFAAIYMTVAASLGQHRMIWRYTAISDLLKLAEGIVYALLLFVVYQFVFRRELFAFPSLMAIHAIVFGGMMVTQRLLHRAWHEGLFTPVSAKRTAATRSRLLLAGARDHMERFIKLHRANPDSPYFIVGVIDTARAVAGETLHGIPVLGNISDLPRVLDQLVADKRAPQRVVFSSVEALQKLDPAKLAQLSDTYGFKISSLPDATALHDTDGAPVPLKSIAIEDLLGRPQAHINLQALSNLIAGKRVLVTGAGGSIGSELSKQIAKLNPARLVLVDNSEYNLYRIEQDLAGACVAQLGDIRDSVQLDVLFTEHKPEIVFHAAALKHVPLVELNPAQGVLTNIVGTSHVAQAALKHKALAFVQISTDKAVNPTNIMGASKRLGEYYAQALDLSGAITRFVTVRFGNVLGSSGSVVPLFKRQLELGQNLTVTHADIKRYFMTVHEAVSLVLQASSAALNDEQTRGLIHVLDMGEPIKIMDVAKQMIRLADSKVGIDIVGLRAGEKLFEELFDARETQTKTSDPAILAATTQSLPLADLDAAISDLKNAATTNNVGAIKAVLARIVSGYQSV